MTGTSYDSDGNLLTDTFHTYTWLADGHVAHRTGVPLDKEEGFVKHEIRQAYPGRRVSAAFFAESG